MNGVVTEFAVPTAGSFPNGILLGPDGNMWFTESVGNRIGRITPTGSITEFQIPTLASGPRGIAAGPDGNLWFTELHNIGRITTAGAITEYALDANVFAFAIDIAAGPDGNLWFTARANGDAGNGLIGRMTMPGAPTCVTDSHTLCLNNGRFAVTAAFQQTPSGPSFPAAAVPLTNNSGYFWFFDASNIELVAKVLTGCPVNDEYWVFAGGLTDVGVEMKVTDTVTGASKSYSNTFGTPFQPIQDSSAFPCP